MVVYALTLVYPLGYVQPPSCSIFWLTCSLGLPCVIPYTLSGWLSDNGPPSPASTTLTWSFKFGIIWASYWLGKSKRPIYHPGYHPGYHQKNTRGEAYEVIAGSCRVDWLHISQKLIFFIWRTHCNMSPKLSVAVGLLSLACMQQF